MREAIAVDAARRSQALDPMHRLLWTQVYEVFHNTPAQLFGRVRLESEHTVEHLFKIMNLTSPVKGERRAHSDLSTTKYYVVI